MIGAIKYNPVMLTLLRMCFFGAVFEWRRVKKAPSLKSVTYILL